ncbi:MAG: hypothetical protein WEA34_06535 [Gemmatimonadota bacterium]
MISATRLATAFTLGMSALLIAYAPATAQSKEAFTQERFESLQAEGALILIDVFADWCPTCAAQQDVLTAFRADILYRGDEQVWFSVAETRSDRIASQILAAAGRG